MNKYILAFFFSVLLLTASSSPVHLAKQWDHTFGGTSVETMRFLMETSDKGFLLCGFTGSDSGYDISQPTHGGTDFWIVKTDSLGEKIWDKRFGGNINDQLYSAQQTTDSGFILGGFTGSDSGTGDVSQNSRGSLDFWIVKTDASGNKLWDKRFGGNVGEWMNSVRQTPDGGYILGGYTTSDSSMDVTQHSRGGEDFWVVKTDASGNKMWDKRFGGNSNDELNFIDVIAGGYILGGWTQSDSSGDVSKPSRGVSDYWIVKIDNSGNKIWDNRFGGSDKDVLNSLKRSADGGYILGGYIRSDIGGDVSEPTRDTSFSPNAQGDFWIVRTDSNGLKQWDKRFGGFYSEREYGFTQQTSTGDIVFGGSSYSGIGGDKTENNFGYEQSWLVKTDSTGLKLWDKTIFTDQEDENAFTVISHDGCYVVANSSYADSAGEKTQSSRGQYDYWFIKYCETSQPQLPVANFSVSNSEICSGASVTFINHSVNAGTFHWQFPGGIPSTSDIANPPSVTYPDSGHYSVTLIAVNNDGNDTITITNIVYVHPLPIIHITTNGDSLFAPMGYASYVWSYNNVHNFADTNYYFVALQNGDYKVIVYDNIGCPGMDTLLSFNVNVLEYTSHHELNVFPNPVKNDLHINGLNEVIGGDLRILDLTGRLISSVKIISANQVVSVSYLKPGIYFVVATDNQTKYFARFVKE